MADNVKTSQLIHKKTHRDILNELVSVYSTEQAQTTARLTGIADAAKQPLTNSITAVGEKYHAELLAIKDQVQQELDRLAKSDAFNDAAKRKQNGMWACINKLEDIHETAQKELEIKHLAEQEAFNNLFDGITLTKTEGDTTTALDTQQTQAAEFEALKKRQNDEKIKLTETINLVGAQLNDVYHNAVLAMVAWNNANAQVTEDYSLAHPIKKTLGIMPGFIYQPELYAPKRASATTMARGSQWEGFVNTTVKAESKFREFKTVYDYGSDTLFTVTNERKNNADGFTLVSTILIPEGTSTSATIGAFKRYFERLIAARSEENPSQPLFSSYDLGKIRSNHGDGVALAVARHIISLTNDPNCIEGYNMANKDFAKVCREAQTLHQNAQTALGLAPVVDPSQPQDKQAVQYNPSLGFKPLPAPSTEPAESLTGRMRII